MLLITLTVPRVIDGATSVINDTDAVHTVRMKDAIAETSIAENRTG